MKHLLIGILIGSLSFGASIFQPSGGGAPSGSAGGALAGTYPNPTFAQTGVAYGTPASINLANGVGYVYSNLASVPTGRLLGRTAPGTGAAEALTALPAGFDIGTAIGTSVRVTGGIGSGNGSDVAGRLWCGEGTLPAITVPDIPATDTISIVCPASVTPYEIVMPGAAATGILALSNSANVVTASITAAPTLTGTNFTSIPPAAVTGTAAILGANNFTTTQTITEGTITVSTPARSNTATWNSGGVTFIDDFTNITDTASAAASKFIEKQVGGVDKFTVSKAGVLTASNNANHGWEMNFGGDNGFLAYRVDSGPSYQFFIKGDNTGSGGGAEIAFGNTGILCFKSTAYTTGTDDTCITRTQAGGFGFGTGALGSIAATIQGGVVAADPGCTTTAHVGKQWFDITTTTTVYKVCLNVAGTLTWVTK